MLKLKKENKKKIIAYMIIIIGITFLAKNKIELVTKVASSIFNPIQSEIYKISENMVEMGEGVINFKELLDENEKNRRKINLLEVENNLLSNLKEENERLKTLLDMKKENPTLKIGIVSFRHIYDLYDNFYIDLGENDEIKKDMAVVIDNKLIGKIKVVEKEVSQVELITNNSFKVSAINEKDVLGIVKGDEEDSKRLIFIPSINKDINIGDTITTSGISNIFPKGLIIGRVISKGKEESTFYIEPAVDVLKIKEVIVIGKGEK